MPTTNDDQAAATRLAAEVACPLCRSRLEEDGVELRCADHGVRGRWSHDGILEFDHSDAYWGEVTREEMRAINAAVRRHGWRTALQENLAPSHPDLIDYVAHESRGDWQVLLPLDRERTVAIDIGAGWGANSFALQPNVHRVYAVEKMAERIEFVALRKLEEGHTNLVPVRAELHALPFARASLDVAVVNGVLEWAGLVDPQPSAAGGAAGPRALQERFLRQILSILKPGGYLYVGIENRFGQMFWRGTPDHQGLRFTSLMPRPMARAYTYLRAVTSPRTHTAVRDYRTYTYSLGGYDALLRSCGFDNVQRFAVLPGYNVPMALVPLETTGPMRYYVSRMRAPRTTAGRFRRAARSALARSGLEGKSASCFAFVARRPGNDSA